MVTPTTPARSCSSSRSATTSPAGGPAGAIEGEAIPRLVATSQAVLQRPAASSSGAQLEEDFRSVPPGVREISPLRLEPPTGFEPATIRLQGARYDVSGGASGYLGAGQMGFLYPQTSRDTPGYVQLLQPLVHRAAVLQTCRVRRPLIGDRVTVQKACGADQAKQCGTPSRRDNEHRTGHCGGKGCGGGLCTCTMHVDSSHRGRVGLSIPHLGDAQP
jgi:hypothetical protein